MRSGQIALLDGLRGIAALIVLYFHVLQHARSALPYAALAVDFFFILSGFVISLAYDHRLESGMSARSFLGSRFSRLYPMIFIGTMAGLGISVLRYIIVGDLSISQLSAMSFTSLLTLPELFFTRYPTAYPANMALWSIFFEVFACTIFFMLFWIITGWRLILVLILSFIGLVIDIMYFGTIQVGMNKSNFIGGFPLVIFCFYFGVALQRYSSKAPSGNNWAAPLSAMGLIAALLLPSSRHWSIEMGLVLLVFPAIILIAARLQVQGWMLVACLALGAISYPLYAIHDPILRVFDELAERVDFGEHEVLMISAASIVASIAVAYVMLRWYETPMRRFLSTRVVRREPNQNRIATA